MNWSGIGLGRREARVASVQTPLSVAGKAPTALRLALQPLAGVARYQCGALATVDFPRPIRRIHPSTHRAMKGGIRPIHHASDVAVLERVDMDVIHVTAKILLVADLVLPVAPLPDAALIAQPIRQGTRLAQRQASRELTFQYLPAHREVGIARWQRPQAVHMVRQHHPGIDTERMAGPGCAY